MSPSPSPEEPSIPLRPRSQRMKAKKPTVGENVKPVSSGPKAWTEKEKESLLKAVRNYGSADIVSISRCLPGRTDEMIKGFLSKMKRLQQMTVKTDPDDPGLPQQMVKRERTAPIETWIGITQGNPPIPDIKTLRQSSTSEALPSIFEMISKYESHPVMADEEDVDYAAIYKAMAELMKGDVPKDLNQATCQKMLDLMKRLYMDISEPALAGQIKEEKKRLEQYTFGSHLSLDQSGWEERHLVAGTNIFNFPADMFQGGAFKLSSPSSTQSGP